MAGRPSASGRLCSWDMSWYAIALSPYWFGRADGTSVRERLASVLVLALVASRPATGAVQHCAIHAAIVPDCEHWTSDAKVTPLILPRLSLLNYLFLFRCLSLSVVPVAIYICVSEFLIPRRVFETLVPRLSAQCLLHEGWWQSEVLYEYIQTVHTILISSLHFLLLVFPLRQSRKGRIFFFFA
jgi:hypothetical protein